MKTLIASLLSALGLIHTTPVHNPKELAITDVPTMVYPSEYVPMVIAYNGPKWSDDRKPAVKKKKRNGIR